MKSTANVKRVFVTVGLSLAMSSIGTAVSQASPSHVNYGVVVPFSGAVSFIGQISDSGVYPAVNEINAAGGVDGHQIDVTNVDTKGDPADGLTSLAKYIATTSNIFAVNGPSTTEGPALVPVLNRSKISMMAVAGESIFNRTKLQYFWRPVPPDAANGIAMAIYAKERHETRVAIVFGSDAGSQGDLPGVLAGVKAEGLKIVNSVSLSPSQPSYAAQVARVLASKPNVIMTESDPTTAATFFGELSQQTTSNIAIPGTSATVTPVYLNPMQGAIGKARFASMYSGVSIAQATPNAATAEFKKMLLASGKQVPKPAQWVGNSYSELNYDGVIIQALAATAAKSVQSTVWNSFIPLVANPGAGKVKVFSYAQGVAALKAGKKIEYIGAAGPFHFDSYHNSYAGFVAQRFSGNGQLVTVGSITQQQVAAVKIGTVQ